VPSGPLEPDEEKEIASWVKKVSSKEFKNAVEDTLSDAAKYDPDKARPDDIMNTGHGLSATTRAATKELEAEGKPVPKYSDGEAKPHSLPLYQEIEYIAKHGTTPETMKKLLDGSTEGARKYWYLKFGLRSPEQIPFDDSYDKTGKPPSFKDSKKVKDVDYNQKEMEEWVDNERTRGVLATTSRDTLAKVAKYDPKANPHSKMNSKPGGELIQHMADVFDMKADTIPLYKEIEYMAKLADDQGIPAKMADLFREASPGAREYWYVQLGLRRPEDLDTAPPSFKESIIPQLKKEFKQYDFTQKSKNWKRVMI
jgi:hypothetical protein